MSSANTQYGTLQGVLSSQAVLTGEIRPQFVLSGTISKTVEKIDRQDKTVVITENGTVDIIPDANKVFDKVTVTTDVIGANAEEYKGSYEVTPSVQEQMLPTALKVMRNDVKIKEIPYAEVSNTSGGTTVIIG